MHVSIWLYLNTHPWHIFFSIRHHIPVQDFCVRQDMPCGSTIGPILARLKIATIDVDVDIDRSCWCWWTQSSIGFHSNCGVRTVDVGIPQFAMHSIRETCAAEDVDHAVKLLTQFYREFAILDDNIQIDWLKWNSNVTWNWNLDLDNLRFLSLCC